MIKQLVSAWRLPAERTSYPEAVRRDPRIERLAMKTPILQPTEPDSEDLQMRDRNPPVPPIPFASDGFAKRHTPSESLTIVSHTCLTGARATRLEFPFTAASRLIRYRQRAGLVHAAIPSSRRTWKLEGGVAPNFGPHSFI